MLVPEVKDTHLSVYLRKGCSDDSVLERGFLVVAYLVGLFR